MRIRCEICGDVAIYHETAIEEDHISQRHFCQNHGDRLWLEALPSFDEDEVIDDFKTMLVDELQLDSGLIETDLSDDEIREQIQNSQTLAELFAVLRRR